MPGGAVSKISLPERSWLRAHFRLDAKGRIIRLRRTQPFYTRRGQIVRGTNANGSLVMKIHGRQVPLHRVVRALKEL